MSGTTLISAPPRIFLFLDDPATAVTAPFDGDPRIKTIVCDGDYWCSGRPAKLNDRQLGNLRHALLNAGVGWMLNVDLDERVSCQAFLSETLEGVKSDVLSISLPPMEAVYEAFPSTRSAFRTPWFKPVLAEREASQSGASAILFEMHGDLARLTRHGLFGHIRGKYIVRTGVPDLDLRLHAVVSPDPATVTGLRIAGLELLHFDTLTFEDWREKWGLRVSGDVICKMSDTRLLQFSLIEAAFGAADETALRRIYANMSVVSAEIPRQSGRPRRSGQANPCGAAGGYERLRALVAALSVRRQLVFGDRRGGDRGVQVGIDDATRDGETAKSDLWRIGERPHKSPPFRVGCKEPLLSRPQPALALDPYGNAAEEATSQPIAVAAPRQRAGRVRSRPALGLFVRRRRRARRHQSDEPLRSGAGRRPLGAAAARWRVPW